MSEREYDIIDEINNDEPLIDEEENKDKKTVEPPKDKKDKEDEKDILIYKSQSVSIFKVICHLSGVLEIVCMLFGVIVTAFSGCVSSLSGLILGNIINELTVLIDSEKLPQDKFIEKMDKVKPPLDRLILFLFILGACTFVSNFFMLFLWGYSAMRQMYTLKTKYFELILNQEQSFFDEHNTFEFSNKIQSQLEQIENGLGDRFSQIILMCAEIIAGFTIGFITSWKLTLIICTSFPIIILAVVISDYFSKKLVLKSKDLDDVAGGVAEELLYNIKTVTSFCNFEFELNRYGQLIDEMNKYDKKRILIQGIAFGLLFLASFLCIAISIIVASKMIINKERNPTTKKAYNSGDMLTVIGAVLNIIFSISGLGPNFQIIRKSSIASSDYFYLLSKYKEKDREFDTICPPRETFKGKIEFKNVRFQYPHDNTNKVVLDNFNLVIEPGKKIAIVGESGCGKSTTINLIERLYDVNSGEILIDGINIKKYDLNYLRDLIGYVQQEPVLFNYSMIL